MEISTFASPLQTIQVISVYTYLARIRKHLSDDENFYDTRNSTFSLINSLNNFWDKNPFIINENNKYNDNERAKLIRKLLRKSDLYGETKGQNLDPKYMNLMFDYIVYSTVFEKYGNIYGFLGEIVRKSETSSIDAILNNARETLRKLTHDKNVETTLDGDAVDKIYHESIVQLFPESKRNLTLDSVDFIYAQAGQTLYNSDLKLRKTHYHFDLDSTKLSGNVDNYVFDDCVEIALAIEQLVIKGQIGKGALKIFALPALLYYVHHERENLQSMEMREIVTNPKLWTKAYDLLFAYLRDKMDQVRGALEMDSKYQYFLAAFQFDDQRTMAGREILDRCKLANLSQLEREVERYVNDSDNYKCLGKDDVEQVLESLEKMYEDQVAELMVKDYLFVKAVMHDDAHHPVGVEMETSGSSGSADGSLPTGDAVSAKSDGLAGRSASLGSSSGPLDVDDGPLGVGDVSDKNKHPLGNSDGPYGSGPSSSGSTNGFLSSGSCSLVNTNRYPIIDDNFSRYKDGLITNKHYTPVTKDIRQIPLIINGKSFEYCNESASSIFQSDFLNTFSLERENLMAMKNLYNESRSNKTHCWSSFLPCIAGIIEGNPINSSSNCPIKGTIHFQIIQNSFILHEFTTVRTRDLLSRLGTSLRTIALKASIQTALSRANYIWKRKVNLQFMANSSDIGFPEFPVIDRGFEIAESLGIRGLESMNNLLTQIETDFFISYQSKSRNFTINSQFINKTVVKVDQVIDYDIYLKIFYGKPSSYYGYKLISLENGNVAELRSVTESGEKEFVTLVNVSMPNQKVYKVVDLTSGKLTGNDLYLTERGSLSEKKN